MRKRVFLDKIILKKKEMKKVLTALLWFFILLILGVVCFFFWAKSSTVSWTEYNEVWVDEGIAVNDQNDSIIRLMSYNIGYLSGMNNNQAVSVSRDFYKKNENLAVSLIHNTNASIIGFQEIDFDSKRSFHVNQHQMIASNYYPYGFLAVNWNKKYVPFPYMPVRVHFGKMLSGQSIMSKYPLKQTQRIVLEAVASMPFYYKAFYLERLAQVAVVKHPVRDFLLINVHAEAFDKETRTKQLNYLHQLFTEKAKEMPVVLLGDFNSDPAYENASISVFLDDEEIGSVVENYQANNTYPADKAVERLDYIFFSKKDFELVDSKILTHYKTISDHLPVYGELRFR